VIGRFVGKVGREFDQRRSPSAAALVGGSGRERVLRGPRWSLVVEPSCSSSRGITVAFNGEIYNRVGLRHLLEERGGLPTAVPEADAALVGALFRSFGWAFADHVDGSYAVAIIDVRQEPTAVLASDHTATKPLYYRVGADAIAFGSQIRGLHHVDGGDPSPGRGDLDRYLATRVPLGERTVFEDVLAMAPATTLVWSPSTGARRLPRERGQDLVPRLVGDAEAAHRFRDVLHAEVGKLMEAGPDCCIVVGDDVASRRLVAVAGSAHFPLHTVRVVYEPGGVAAGLVGGRPERRVPRVVDHLTTLTSRRLADDLPALVAMLDQPSAALDLIEAHAALRAVRAAGFDTALSSDGAGRATPDAVAALPWAERAALYTADYRAYLRGRPSPMEVLERDRGLLRWPASRLWRLDQVGQAHGVRVRLPYHQRRVVALARMLPNGLAINRPARSTESARTALALMLRPGEPLWDLARDVLAHGELRRDGLVEPATVDRLFGDQAGRPSARAALTIWALLVYGLWRDTLAP
jgi:asparagine synthase (glutamine-hydrolysing)